MTAVGPELFGTEHGGLASGHRDAYRALYDRYRSTVVGFALRRGCPEAVSEELCQQAFVQLYRRRGDLRPGVPVKPYLMTIVLNLVRRYHRDVSRRKEVPLVEDPPVEPRATRTCSVELRQRKQAVRHAVSALPVGQRRVIEQHWLEERPLSEVAAGLGISYPAVKVRAHRGYARLRVLLGGTPP